MIKTLIILCFIAITNNCFANSEEATISKMERSALAIALDQAEPWYKPNSTARGALESRIDYTNRLVTIASGAVKSVTVVRDNKSYAPKGWGMGRVALLLALMSHWYEESKFALEIHEGSVHPIWTQDAGRAKCLGQLHKSYRLPERLWKETAGINLEATKLCGKHTIIALISMSKYCARLARLQGEGISQEMLLLRMFSAMNGRGCGITNAGKRKLIRYRRMYKLYYNPHRQAKIFERHNEFLAANGFYLETV